MNNFSVRLGGGNFANSGSSLFLVRADGTELQLGHGIEDFARVSRPMDPLTLDFVLFALAVYGCDRSAPRDETDDRWTRQFYLEMPVTDPDLWNGARPTAERMISFLTGDEWTFSFVARDRDVFGKEFKKAKAGFTKRTKIGGEAVSLFSGGLDSLIGVIDWLEENPGGRLTVSGAYDKHAEPANADQDRLFAMLNAAYPNRIFRITSRMGLLGGGQESSYRSRSFCFVAFGLMAASFLEEENGKLLIPENGSIALNYPLTPARSGSLSTRTVHPHFLDQMRELLRALGLRYDVENPYEMRTKGEMIESCRNPNVLKATYLSSISCGNRKRYKVFVPGAKADHCGYCVPCIFRRAALHKAGLPDGDYGVKVEDSSTWGRVNLNDPNLHLEAVKDFVLREDSAREIWRTIIANGRVPLPQKADYIALVQHQRAELKSWMEDLAIIPGAAE